MSCKGAVTSPPARKAASIWPRASANFGANVVLRAKRRASAKGRPASVNIARVCSASANRIARITGPMIGTAARTSTTVRLIAGCRRAAVAAKMQTIMPTDIIGQCALSQSDNPTSLVSALAAVFSPSGTMTFN